MGNKRLRNKSEGQPISAQRAVQRTTMSITKHRSGPLPAPEELHQYDQIVPGAAERILQMAEKQQNHRIAQEKHDLHEGVKYARRGQFMAFMITSAAFVAGVFLALQGQAIVAGILISTVLVSLVASFLGSRASPPADKE